MKNISIRQWGIAVCAALVCGFFAAGLTQALLSSGLGSANVAGWVQAIGATAGIAIAIWIPYEQRQAQLRDDKIRCFHHALALVNDLRGRATYLRDFLTKGDRPLATLTSTATLFFKRYEALYDRELYAHLPGPIIDRITNLSGTITGVETVVAFVSSTLDNKPTVMLPPSQVWSQGGDPLKKLYQELDDLFTALENEAKKAHV